MRVDTDRSVCQFFFYSDSMSFSKLRALSELMDCKWAMEGRESLFLLFGVFYCVEHLNGYDNHVISNCIYILLAARSIIYIK